MTLDEFVNRAMDVPFEEKGRSYEGWDCYGLIYIAYRDVYGINLPVCSDGYQSTRLRTQLQNLISRRKVENWELNDPHQPGDVALVRMMGRDCHVGLMLSGWNMLHVVDRISTAIEPIDRPPWRDKTYNKIEGIYRYVG